tara:strand:+ start:973 stop:3282 length:2310 start_codon:yes stop_codon:yes gene_type:complete
MSRKYKCGICDTRPDQLSHHKSHLDTYKHKNLKEILRLKLESMSNEKLFEKYKTNNIKEIIYKIETEKINNLNIYQKMSISNKEALKDKIHDIHNYLRNNGGGYGMNALKVFNIIYGLKKIEENNLIDLAGLCKPCCEFSYILKMANENKDEELTELIQVNILNSIASSKIRNILFYEIPKNISGSVFSYLIKEINEISEIEKTTNTQLCGKIYEYFIGRDQTAISELGAYFTDRHITEFLYEEEPIILNESLEVPTMCDPFGGSGGFSVGYLLYLIKNYPNINWKNEINKVNHFDMNEDVIKYASLEFFCATGEIPVGTLRYANSFTDEFNNKKFKKVFTNPPYGGDKSSKSQKQSKRDKVKNYIKNDLKTLTDKLKIKQREKQLKCIANEERNEKYIKELSKVTLAKSSRRIQSYAKKYNLKGNNKEAVSLIQLMDLVDEGGTVIAVLIDGVYTNNIYKDLRKCLVENFNVRKIINIEENTFDNTPTKTKIVIFDKTENKTENIEFSDLIVEKYDEDLFDEINGEILCVGYSGEGKKLKPDIKNIKKKIIKNVHKNQILEQSKCSLNSKDYQCVKINPKEGFKLVSMNSLFEFSPKTEKSETVEVYREFKIQDIDNKLLSSDNNKTINKMSVNTEDICIEGDILLSHVRPKERKTLLITSNIKDLDSYCFKIKKLRPKHKKYPHILLYVSLIIHCNDFEEWFCKGSTYPTFKISQLKNMYLSLPKSEEKINKYVTKFSKYYESKNMEEFNKLLIIYKSESIESITIS